MVSTLITLLVVAVSMSIGYASSIPRQPQPESQSKNPYNDQKLFYVDKYSLEGQYVPVNSQHCRTSDIPIEQRNSQLFKFLEKFLGGDDPPVTQDQSNRTIDPNATPIVVWHGLGQSCCDPNGIGRVVSILERVTNAYVYSIKVGETWLDDTVNGFFMPAEEQVNIVCKQLSNDSLLAKGYHALGFSQGGQLFRALAQKCTNPPMKNLVTLGSQHQGIFGLPRCPGSIPSLCKMLRTMINQGVYTSMAQSNSMPAQYWHDPMDRETYVNKSTFIARINNEGLEKNQTYVENLTKLNRFVMIKNLNDSTVFPIETQHFGFFVPGSTTDILDLRKSSIYTEDWIGLKRLDMQNKLVFLQVEGDHIDYSVSWFIKNVVQDHLMP